MRRPAAVAEPCGRGQADRGPALADDERRDRELQPVEQACGQERRHRAAAALHEDPAPAARVQRGEQRGQVEHAIRVRHGEHLGGALRPIRVARAAGEHGRRGAVGEHPVAAVEAVVRVEHHADGVRARHEPGGKLRIVGRDGTGADHDRVAQGAHAVQVQQVAAAVDVARIARAGGDEAVETLPEVRHRQWRTGRRAQRAVKLVEFFVTHRAILTDPEVRIRRMTREPLSWYGDPATLAIDRALGELRSGRAARVVTPAGARVALAVEALRPAALAALRELSGRDPRLATTAERAAALGWTGLAGAVSVPLAATAGLDDLRVLAGAAPVDPARAPGSATAAVDTAGLAPADPAERAVLELAKHARLLPTILSIRDEGEGDPRLLTVTSAELEAYGGAGAVDLERLTEAAVPLADAPRCKLVVFCDRRDGSEHVAVLVGDVDPAGVVDVRVHSACLTGDLFGSLRCDCGDQLRGAIRRFAGLGAGVLLYVEQEGRGIGLVNKLRAYTLQEQGLDTIDANLHLGFAADERRYEVAAALLRELGIGRIRLHTNNPRKLHALEAAGLEVVGFRTLAGAVNPHNERYIQVRRERAGHLVPDPE
jgi:GTP cyclohydrolase II